MEGSAAKRQGPSIPTGSRIDLGVPPQDINGVEDKAAVRSMSGFHPLRKLGHLLLVSACSEVM
jgi:hypothetical protein